MHSDSSTTTYKLEQIGFIEPMDSLNSDELIEKLSVCFKKLFQAAVEHDKTVLGIRVKINDDGNLVLRAEGCANDAPKSLKRSIVLGQYYPINQTSSSTPPAKA